MNQQLNIQPNTPSLYDLIIIGSGPAGCAASIYASRYGVTNLVLGKTAGGTVAYAHKVENYPGLLGLSGAELMQKVEEHVKALGSEIIYDPVNNLKKEGEVFSLSTVAGKTYQARAVIAACGTQRRKLNIPGEKELTGRGVSYCVTCDAPFFKDKTVALVGGSDAACSGAVHLGQFAKKIYLIYRKEALRAEPFWVSEWEKLVNQGRGEFINNTQVIEILDKVQNKVSGIKLDKPYKNQAVLAVDGVFIEIGGVPGSDLVKSLGVDLDQEDYVRVNAQMETKIPGLLVAGDMIDKAKVMQQVLTAMASGAVAASSAYKYLKGQAAPRLLGV